MRDINIFRQNQFNKNNIKILNTFKGFLVFSKIEMNIYG